MRVIKALLVLLFLAPTLAAAEPNPESSFLRIQRDENREPVALQTVIAKYVPASGAKGVEIDLVAVVHIGEKAYYERPQLNTHSKVERARVRNRLVTLICGRRGLNTAIFDPYRPEGG